MTAGQQFVKAIKPVGCVIFLLIFVAFLIYCFLPPSEPLPGFEPSHDSTYYAAHLDELQAELEEKAFNRLGGGQTCETENGKLIVSVPQDHYEETREALLYYYSEDLIIIIEK